MNMRPTLLVLFFTILHAQADPVISEFVASNTSGLTDEDGETEDWIEIHNPDAQALDLDGWHLTDKADDPGKWNFPAVSLPAGGYLVIFASNKNRNIPGSNLHTDFKLSAGGEYLALTRPDESIVQEFAPTYPPQNSDFSYSAAGFHTPTPGVVNGPALSDLPPLIDTLTGGESQPTADEEIVVTANVTPQAGTSIDSVILSYRVGYGTSTTLTMTAIGNQYRATIPSSQFEEGDMVRWFLTATSDGGAMARVPLFEDPQESPEYLGTVVTDSSIDTDLPVLHWFVSNESASTTRTGTKASLFFEGNFYDNIFCRIRGQSAGSWPKHKFKFDFQKGNHFRWSSDQPKVEEFNLQSFYREMFTLSSNSSYMREPLMFRYLQETGVTAPDTRYLSVRRNGSFYGLFSFIEQIDEDFLKKNGYSGDGPLYKAAWQGGGPATLSPNPQPGQYRKSTLKEEPFTDLATFTAGIAFTNPDRFTYVRDHVNLAQWINTIAAMNVPFNHDQLTKNYYIYLEPETGEWQRFPWDVDQSFPIGQYINQENWSNPLYGDRAHTQELRGGGANPQWANVMHAAIMDDPTLRSMYLRRVKTLADEYLAENSDSNSVPFINADTTARYFVPGDSSLDGLWNASDFDDTSWSLGAGGFGFENVPGEYHPWIGTRIRPPESTPGATSFYLRYRFNVTAEELATISVINLRVRWDDGFVAYLNGSEIERDGVTPATPTWNTRSTSRRDSLNDDFTEFAISTANLVEGENVFAIQSFNSSANNSDQLLQFELKGASLPYFESKISEIRELIEDDADDDRTFWRSQGVNLGVMANGVNEILNLSLPTRRNAIFNTYANLFPANPPAMSILAFGAIENNPASGNQDEEYIEIQNTEDTAIDISNWTITGGITHTFLAGTVIPANGSLYLTPDVLTFRNRAASPTRGEDLFVQGNYDGKISNFGELLEIKNQQGNLIVATMTPANPSDVQQYLAISEIMYHPVIDDEEFIEVMNTSTSVTLDLTNVSFTAGIDYTFPAGLMLAPGKRYVINFSDFQNMSRLNNGSDRIKLEDVSNSTVRDFSYNDDFPWPENADGEGRSLVLIAPQSSPDPDLASSWRPSSTDGGNPATSDSTPFTGGNLLNYTLGKTDLNSLFSFSSPGLVTLNLQQNLTADDAEVIVQTSSDLMNWETTETTLTEVSYLGNVINSTREIATDSWHKMYFRIKVQLR